MPKKHVGRNPKRPAIVSSVGEIQEQRDKVFEEKRKKKKAEDARNARPRLSKGKTEHFLDSSENEDKLITMIDYKDQFDGMKPIIDKLLSDKFNPTTFFGSVSKYMAAQLTSMALTGEKEKNRLDALKHCLALAGHTATQKHEIARVDADTERSQLMSIVRGASKELEAQGIEIVDDSKDSDQD